MLKHLDDRGIHVEYPLGKDPRVLQPGQVLKVPGEGMPIKKSERKGDLYLNVKILFPSYQDLQRSPDTTQKLRELLPQPQKVPPSIQAEEVDNVSFEEVSNLDGVGDGEDGSDWVDEDDEEAGTQAQCTQQ